MYHRFDSALLPKENIANTLTRLVDHTISLSDHARLLEKVTDWTMPHGETGWSTLECLFFLNLFSDESVTKCS